MEAFSVRVTNSDNIKPDLFVSVNGRLVHPSDGVCLVSQELAEQYKDAIKARRIKSGDREFDAEVIRIYKHPDFSESVIEHTENIRKKLEKWNYPSPQNITSNDSGWIIRVQCEDKAQLSYLMRLGKDGSITLSDNKNKAKTYKHQSFVQKALKEINQNPKFRAFATDVK